MQLLNTPSPRLPEILKLHQEFNWQGHGHFKVTIDNIELVENTSFVESV